MIQDDLIKASRVTHAFTAFASFCAGLVLMGYLMSGDNIPEDPKEAALRNQRIEKWRVKCEEFMKHSPAPGVVVSSGQWARFDPISTRCADLMGIDIFE